MQTKLQMYQEVSEKATKRLWSDTDYFRSFLVTSARLYKYRFKDQMMIHDQRPNAVACAEYDTWGREDIANRFVKRGSKGIALIDDSKDKTRLRYVFDFADTNARDERSKEPFFWSITEENRQLVGNALGSSTGSIDSCLISKAHELARKYSADYSKELLNATNGTFLEELDDFNVQVEFEQLLETSLSYSLLSRCGYEPSAYFDEDDFRGIHDFNSTEAMTVLGTAVSDLSEQVLRTIERTLKDFEKEKFSENQRFSENPSLSASNKELGGQIPQEERKDFENGRNDITKNNHGERNGIHSGRGNWDLSPEPERTRGRTDWQVRNAPQEIPQGEPQPVLSGNADKGNAGRTSQGDRQDSEGQTGQNASRYDEVGGRDGAAQSDRPDEMGGIDEQHQALSRGNSSERADLQLNTEKAVQTEETPNGTAFLMPENKLYGILKHSDEMNLTKPEILTFFLEYEDSNRRKDLIKAAYGNRAVEFQLDGETVGYKKDGDGLRIWEGAFDERTSDVHLSWDLVQSFVADLIDKHEYIDVPVQEDFFDIEPEQEESGQVQLSLFGEDIPLVEKPTKAKSSLFIGNVNTIEALRDEIMRGSGFVDGKFRIDDYYRKNKPTNKDFADFLKKEYGIGGHSGNGDIGFVDHDSKGICIRIKTEDGEQPVNFNWNEVAKYTAELLDSHKYLTHDDIDSHIRQAQYTIARSGDVGVDDFRYNKAVETLTKYGLLDKNAELSKEMYHTEYPEISGKLVRMEVDAPIDMWERLAANGLVPNKDSVDKLMFESDGGDWNKFYIPDMFGNVWNSVDALDVLTPAEYKDMQELVSEAFEHHNETKEVIAGLKEEPLMPEADEYELKIGDKIELDDGKFQISDITTTPFGVDYEMRDLNSAYPIFRVLHEDDLYNMGFAVLDEAEKAEPSANREIHDLPTEAENKPFEKHNYRITDDNLGVSGAKAKYHNNVEAIKLLNTLEDENRLATPEEQEILSKYVGWGGLPNAFDSTKSDWSAEYTELKALLSPDEYESARASTLNAHYTSPTVISAIYQGLENLGFKSGNVLEPSMGSGNFFGMLPEAMQDSKLYGVELDSVTGRIAKQLYQKADISVTGFESKPFPDNFFDVAVGNVPFGAYKLPDKRYDKLNLNIHDYFFAKSLDKVRAGGVVAFVTSKGTLDKENPSFRKYLGQRAELLGAIRLPNNAFKANAGTEVTSDIIFLQKRDKLIDIEPEWAKLGETADGVPVNKYFEEHPEMILGTMKQGVEFSMHGNEKDTACVPLENAVLSEQLKEAVSHIQGKIPEIELDEIADGKSIESIPADINVRNYSFTLVNNEIFYREDSRMNKVSLPKNTEDRVKAMLEMRDCVRTLIDYQLNEYSDDAIRNQQYKLNTIYDNFSKKFGLINSSANAKAFSEDSAYYLLCSLEVINEQGELERKADMFTKRTIKQKSQITSVDTASEALAVSISEKAKVDMPFMSELTGKTEQQLYEDLHGVIFMNPEHTSENDGREKYVAADEYLSGNVRDKLELAKRSAELYPDDYNINVKALEQAMPKPLEASEIDVRLGATWLDTDTIHKFICETLQVPRYMQRMFDVNFSPYTSEWQIDGKNVDRSNVLANMTFGTARKNAYSIIEDTLNLRDARVYDRVEQPDGKITSVLNKKETMLAAEKQEAVKNAFKDWIFKEPERREKLVEKYNVLFNSTRPREYDGSHINFVGMNPEIKLREHQVNAIAHTMYGGNTLLAHEVGAGKTYEMVAAAMESKRLGLCNKSLFVVPNHLTEQMGSEFLRLYPSANILVATKKDFETKNRKRLCAKIATGDYDAIIIGHSQLEKIPVSPERQERMLRNQISELTEGISSLGKQRGQNFSVKQLEKTKRTLETKLKKLIDSPKRDDTVTFEELGVDKMFVDEAHNFKNLFLYTKMRNVAGIQQTEAQKSADLYMKCQYLDELTGGRGLTFATGTPISNSMTELYTMQRYLQSDKLKQMGLSNFDAWAANFGETVTAIELAPEGTGYRAKTRFAKFFNLPELMNIFRDVADIKTSDMLNLPVPEAHYHNVVVQPTEMQKEMVSELSERAKLIHEKLVAPEEDNMLKVTSDGRKIGLDQRMMNPLLPDEAGTKVNICLENVHRIWEETAERKSAQLVFCDFSTPKSDGSFNLYDDLRSKLIAKGVPKEEIAFIHDADTEQKKKDLFAKVRKGQVRVLIGSTAKMGAGTNVQDKLKALHDLDCPWRPADLERASVKIA